MKDCTETHQAEMNRKIKANDKLRQVLMTMPEEHRVLINRESFQSKLQITDDWQHKKHLGTAKQDRNTVAILGADLERH